MILQGSTFEGFSVLKSRFEINFTLEDLFDFFCPIMGPKEALLQWNATTLLPDTYERHKKNVEFAYAVVLDKDCGDIGELESCIKHLRSQGLAFFIHSSHSHLLPNKEHKGSNTTGPYDCFRVVLPTSRPVTLSEYSGLVESVFANVLPQDPSKYLTEAKTVAKATGKPPKPRGWDPASKSIAQFWYGPGCPEEMHDQIVFEVEEGEPLDVEKLLALSGPSTGRFSKKKRRGNLETVEGAPSSKIGKALERFARALEKAECPLDHVELDTECRSQCPACHASADSLCVKTDGDHLLVKCFANCETKDILAVLGLSFGDLTVPDMEADDRCIQRAFDSDRTEPYTEAELAAMQPLHERWVLITPSGFFLRGPKGYDGPHDTERLTVTRARDILAPAITAGVETAKITAKGGKTKKTIAELLDEYGQAVPTVRFSYTSNGMAYLDGNTLYQSVATRADVGEPEFDKEIDKWMKLFAGSQYEKLQDWLATFLDLARPTSALYITGTSGAGKDLLIAGLARFWQGRSTTFERAISKFNDPLLKSPLVVANEQLVGTSDYSWDPVEALKAMISDTSRIIEVKNVSSSHLSGCCRVIMATNKDSFKLGKQPTQSDIVALDERILKLEPSGEAKAFLIDIGGYGKTQGWVDGAGLARHVLWLQENRRVKYGSRFIVEGTGGMSDLLSSEGRGSAVILRALTNALLGVNRDETVCCYRNGEVWCNWNKLRNAWGIYEKNQPLPDDIGSSLAAVLEPAAPKFIWAGGKSVRMRQVVGSVFERFLIREGRLEEMEELISREPHTEN